MNLHTCLLGAGTTVHAAAHDVAGNVSAAAEHAAAPAAALVQQTTAAAAGGNAGTTTTTGKVFCRYRWAVENVKYLRF